MSPQETEATGGAEEQQPLAYRDLNLRLGYYDGETGKFKVWVEGEAPGGTMKPEDAIERTYDPAAFWKDPENAIGGLMGNLEGRRMTREALAELGSLLADLALPEGQVRSLFEKSLAKLKDGEGLRLRLHIDALPLTQLPWEYLVLPETAGEVQATDFLALRPELSIARTDTVEAAKGDLPNRDKARIVGVLSSPDGLDKLEVDDDQNAVEEAVKDLNEKAGKQVIEIIWAERPSTLVAVEEALSGGADLFLFAGHGDFDRLGQKGIIVLENEDYTPYHYEGEKLALLLRDKGVRLADLGACNTGRRDGKNVWNGVAPALTKQRIPAVLANQFKIKNTNAKRAAEVIYPLVLCGYTIDEALSRARQAIFQSTKLEHRDWASLVLYLHDDTGVLFPPPQEGDPQMGSGFYQVIQDLGQVSNSTITGIKAKHLDRSANVKQKADTVKDSTVTAIIIGEL